MGRNAGTGRARTGRAGGAVGHAGGGRARPGSWPPPGMRRSPGPCAGAGGPAGHAAGWATPGAARSYGVAASGVAHDPPGTPVYGINMV